MGKEQGARGMRLERGLSFYLFCKNLASRLLLATLAYFFSKKQCGQRGGRGGMRWGCGLSFYTFFGLCCGFVA